MRPATRHLRASIEELLRADVGATGFMERRPPKVAATVDVPVGERPGTVMGPYKLLQGDPGEGGMGHRLPGRAEPSESSARWP